MYVYCVCVVYLCETPYAVMIVMMMLLVVLLTTIFLAVKSPSIFTFLQPELYAFPRGRRKYGFFFKPAIQVFLFKKLMTLFPMHWFVFGWHHSMLKLWNFFFGLLWYLNPSLVTIVRCKISTQSRKNVYF